MSERWSAAALPAAVALTALLWASVSAQTSDDAALRVQLEHKLRLVAALISDSPSAQRIASSGNAQAMTNLDEGRLHHAHARELLARGDLAGARAAADDALGHLAAARRLVPDVSARQAAARQRHDQMQASLERLIESWRARAGSEKLGDGSELADAQGLMASARQAAQEGRVEQANQMLSRAETQVLAGMSRSLGSQTIDYTVRPTSPAEEFTQELSRHRGLAELVPLAVRDLKPKPEAVALIDRYGETSRTLQAQAMQQFQAGDTTQALAHLRNATLYVQRALTAAGLAAPQPTGTPP